MYYFFNCSTGLVLKWNLLCCYTIKFCSIWEKKLVKTVSVTTFGCFPKITLSQICTKATYKMWFLWLLLKYCFVNSIEQMGKN